MNKQDLYRLIVGATEPVERPATLEKYTLRYLHPDIGNAFIVGVIIAKQSPKKLADERAVWNFTLRDSPQDYINVACWGRKESVSLLNEKFHVGDVGKLLFVNKIFKKIFLQNAETRRFLLQIISTLNSLIIGSAILKNLNHLIHLP